MSLGTMEQRTEGMKRQAQELIEQAYHRGFKAGREDRQDWEKDQADRLIEKGRNEAWEAFKTIHKFAPHCFLDCFPNGNDELYSLSIHEVIRRVHAYEEQKKQEEDERIEVGDEVVFHNEDRPDTVMFVMKVAEDGFIDGMDAKGNLYAEKNPKNWTKTGRHLNEIAEVLKKMQEGENHV